MMYLFTFQLIAVALILSANTSNGFDLSSILKKADAVVDADPITEPEVAPAVHEKKDEGIVSMLLEAVMSGDVDKVKEAVAAGEDIDITNINGWSSATFAVARGDLSMLNVLIEAEINLNTQNNEGITPLMLAASQGDRELVEALIHANADPTHKNSRNETAYSLANGSGRKLVSMIIAEATVLRRLHDEDHHSSLLVEDIKGGAYVNLQTGSGWTPMIYAAAAGHAKEVEELIELGANINHVESDGWTALHFAALSGYEETVAVLLKYDMDVYATTENGRTARDMAETAEHTQIVELIDQYVAQQEAEL